MSAIKELLTPKRLRFIAFAVTASFGAYFCMYAFRKPFTVGAFEGLSVWGVDYKIMLIIAQVVGYMLSKFIGIKVVSELGKNKRIYVLLGLILVAELALVGFGLVPTPWNVVFLFFNGLPLGMIWGIVFSYLEGRRTSEILGAGLSASFIISSGAVKSVGKVVMDSWGVSEFWVPAVTGALFIIPLLIFAWMLEQIPAPDEEDILERTEREPMSGQERVRFFSTFALGLILLIVVYAMLTAYRDFRDNFAPELWAALGYSETPEVFTLAELPIAFGVLLALGLTMFIQNNRRAFLVYHWMVLGSLLLVGLVTVLLQQGMLDPAAWMILVGLGMYICYVPFGCIFFDRMLAAFRFRGNAGFMIYVVDAFGYLGSVGILLYKNFGQPNLSWLDFFINMSYALAVIGALCVLFSLLYFKAQFRRRVPVSQAT